MGNSHTNTNIDENAPVATVYVGHASLELSDGTYISWWPTEHWLKNREGGARATLEDDIKDEDDEYPEEYEINIHNESAAKRWWQSFKQTGSYCAHDMNCSKAVVTALKKGGIKFEKEKTVWWPGDIMPAISEKHFSGNTGELYDGSLLNFAVFARLAPITFSIFFISIIGFAVWFQHDVPNEFKVGYALSGCGCILLFISLILVVALFTGKLRLCIDGDDSKCICFCYFIGLLCSLGPLFYFMGGCAMAHGYNTLARKSEQYKSIYTSLAGIYFAEQTFVALHSLFLSFGWYFAIYSPKWRRIVYHGLFLFVAVIDFFGYVVIGSNEMSHQLKISAQFLATMYFFAIFFIVLHGISFIDRFRERLRKSIILFVFCGILILIMLFIFIAYIVFMVGFKNAGFIGNAQFFGIGLFVFVSGGVIAIDSTEIFR